MKFLAAAGAFAATVIALTFSAQTGANAQGSGTQNFQKACVLGLQSSYQANQSAAPSARNLAGVSQERIDLGCQCVTRAFAAAGNAKPNIVEYGIRPSDFGMTFRLSRIGWYNIRGGYVDETVEDDNSLEGMQEKYRGNPLNNLRNMFAPPPRERFVRQAQTCLQRAIDPNKLIW